MKIDLYGAELSLIPETDDDRRVIQSFAKSIENNDNELAYASLDGVNDDELVVQPYCDAGASHCLLCKRPL
jgi:hypothetical protein